MATSFSGRHIGQGNVGVQLIKLHEDAADDAADEIIDRIIARCREYMPAHDPVRDPDPLMNLRERIRVIRDAPHRWRIVVDTPYAAKQHEALWFDHPRGGGPKYLERAITETIPEMEGILASKVRARMNKRYGARRRQGAIA